MFGGINSAAGACAWHVLGGEQSLKDWALSQGWAGRRVSQENATGIPVAALDILAVHFHLLPGGQERH